MIWTYYSGEQVTVELYGTKFVSSSDQSNQLTSPQGTCTYVSTERTRVFLDGTTKKDAFTNTYMPAGDSDCKGTKALVYDENFQPVTTTTTTTTLPGATTTIPAATTSATSVPSSVP